MYTIGVLKKLGVNTIRDLDSRIKYQKKAYFAKSMGIIPPYSFNLYIHGPYSPDLSHDIYASINEFDKIVEPEFAIIEIKEKFVKLNDWLNGKTSRQLEIAATYHWLRNGRTTSEIKRDLQKIKNASEEEIVWCHEQLNSLGV